MRPLITATDCAKLLRSVGIPVSVPRLVDGIESGYFPFGIVKATGPHGRRSVEIFRVDLERWLREKGVEL